jgi:hypothetical protein
MVLNVTVSFRLGAPSGHRGGLGVESGLRTLELVEGRGEIRAGHDLFDAGQWFLRVYLKLRNLLFVWP